MMLLDNAAADNTTYVFIIILNIIN